MVARSPVPGCDLVVRWEPLVSILPSCVLVFVARIAVPRVRNAAVGIVACVLHVQTAAVGIVAFVGNVERGVHTVG